MNQNEEQVKAPYTTPKLLIYGDMVSIVKAVGGSCDDNDPSGIGIGVKHSDGYCYNS